MIAPDLITPLAKENFALEMRLSISDERPGELMFARYSSTYAPCGGPALPTPLRG